MKPVCHLFSAAGHRGPGLPTCGAGLALVLCLTATALAQQAVQLPTYSMFTVPTTVNVPDGGSAYMGGVNYAQSGSSQYGRLCPNRSYGSSRTATSCRVTATIHDFQAMDQYLLSLPSPGGIIPRGVISGTGPRGTQPNLAGPAGPLAPPAAVEAPKVASLADLQAQRQQERELRVQQARQEFENGQRAEEAGNLGAARVYYHMAANRVTGEFREEILARLRAIQPQGRMPNPTPATSLSSRKP